MVEENKPKELTLEECYKGIEDHLTHIENQLAEQSKRSFLRSARTTVIVFLASITISGLAILLTGATQMGITQPIELVWEGAVLVIFGIVFILLISWLWKV